MAMQRPRLLVVGEVVDVGVPLVGGRHVPAHAARNGHEVGGVLPPQRREVSRDPPDVEQAGGGPLGTAEDGVAKAAALGEVAVSQDDGEGHGDEDDVVDPSPTVEDEEVLPPVATCGVA